MKLNELLQDRVAKIERMTVLTNSPKLGEAEDAEYTKLEKEVEDLNKNIERMKNIEKLNMSVGVDRASLNPVADAPFSISKFLRESMTHTLSGTELQVANRGKELFSSSKDYSIRGYAIPFDVIGRASDTNFTITNQFPELAVIKSPAQIIAEQLGVKIISGINGKYDLPYMNQLSATFLAETAAGTGVTLASYSGKATLSPRALQCKMTLTQEWLNQTSPQIQAGIQRDILDSIWRGLFKDLLSAITGNTSVSSGATLGTGFTFNNCALLQTKLTDVSALDKISYVTDFTELSTLLTTIKSGSTSDFIASYIGGNYSILGRQYVPSSLQVAKTMTLGDFRYSAIGLFGQSFDLFLDPYGTNADNHTISLYATAMVHTKVINPGAFAFYTKS